MYFSAKILCEEILQPIIHQIREESFIEEEPRKSKRFSKRRKIWRLSFKIIGVIAQKSMTSEALKSAF
jgi:hypothetical protein